jgi:hypothetical protein
LEEREAWGVEGRCIYLVRRALSDHKRHLLGVLFGDVLLTNIHHSSASLLLLEFGLVVRVSTVIKMSTVIKVSTDYSSKLASKLLSLWVDHSSLALELFQSIDFGEVAYDKVNLAQAI